MDQLVEQFLGFLVAEKNSSQNTISAYRNDLTQWYEYLKRQRGLLSWLNVRLDDLVAGVDFLDQQGVKPATLNRKVSSVKSFFDFLMVERIIATDPTEDLPNRRAVKSLPKPLTPFEMDDLLERPDQGTPRGYRDYAMMSLLYATGMRVSELIALDTKDAQLTEELPRLHCVGRDDRERTLPLHPEAAETLAYYLAQVRPDFLKGKVVDALFINRRGERLTRQGFWLILKNYVAETQLEKSISPHTFRHSFATHMLEGGVGFQEVAGLLGHSNPYTTQVYKEVLSKAG